MLIPQSATAAQAPPVLLEQGRSQEMLESSALFLVTPPEGEISLDNALRAYREGQFAARLRSRNSGEFHDWRVWIALPFSRSPSLGGGADAGAESSDEMRRVIGVGGIFVRLPRVYLACEGEEPREILATRTGQGGALSARYFTYVRSQSFAVAPGQTCLALINTSSNDNPNIGIFREGELGSNQVVALLLKGGATATLLIIGLSLAVVSYLASRPLGLLVGIAYSLTMLQNEASLFATTFINDPLVARTVWEGATLLAILSMVYAFLFGFRQELRLTSGPVRAGVAGALMVPLIAIAYVSNSSPDIMWAFYLALMLFALTVTFRLDIARPLRYSAGGVLILSAVGALLIEPFYIGRELSDLAIEWFRDAFRLSAGVAMLAVLLVDVLQSRRERARMLAEQIEVLEAQAETDRRLLDTEREYARAREAASRTKAQLAAASHDIRQPIVGLRAAVSSEAERLSPALQERLAQAIDYLEHLTREYSNQENSYATAPAEDSAETQPYPLDLIARAVENMFAGQARQAGIELTVESADCSTQVPALALIRSTSNLVANALRHAGASAIQLRIAHENGRCQIVIADDGCGMDAQALTRLQHSGAKSATSDGDGLGLAIVHELANRHSFGFTLQSTPGEGTQAILDLPA